MNPRRVHELMLKHFPSFNCIDHEWSIAVDQNGVRMPVIEALLAQNIAGPELLVEVNRKSGNFLSRQEALAFIVEHAAEGLRITDRAFTGFVVIAQNGVATGWQASP